MVRQPRKIGRFDVEGQVAAGAMGTIFRAVDPATGQKVALKVTDGVTEIDAARFEREGRALATLDHPGIVRFVELGTTPEGEAYIAMEWLEGEDLRARLRRGGLTVPETLALGRGVAAALSVLHARGLMHRDLKPGNLFLVGGRPEAVKLIDFGLARHEESTIDVTRTGVVVGTPAYMSPEQARGQRDIDGRADLFSLGCVMFRCLTGRTPFEGSNVMAVLTKVLLEESPRVRALCPDVPAAVDILIARMLRKDPLERFPTALALMDSIDALEVSMEDAPSMELAPPSRSLGLTTGEQRVMAMVLVGRAPASPTERAGADTLPSFDPLPLLGTSPAARLAALVREHKGHIDHLLDGTRLVTVSGSRVATDQAARAARCALALAAELPRTPIALAAWRTEVGTQPRVGEAIERAVALLGRSERAVEAAGEAHAAAMIALDDMAAALLDARFVVKPGAEGPELVGVREHESGARTLLGKATSMVGREWEMSSIQALFRECAEEQVARAVLVTGAAGMGKSRLAHELVWAIAAAHPEVEVWMGRADSLRAGSPLGLLSHALRGAFGLRKGEPVADQRRRVLARVARRVPSSEARRVAEFLGEIVDAPFGDEAGAELRAARADPRIMGDQMCRAFEDLLAAECAAHPVLLVLEDLHWGDVPTVRFVGEALKDLERLPWMVLALSRPEVHELFPRLWAGRNLQEIPLRPLARKAAERLVLDVLGGAATEDAARIAARADGNAFYLEELIRAVAEGRGAESARMPETVLAMVQARLEALDPEVRRVLRAASIFGEVFWPGGVESLLGGVSMTGSFTSLLAEREVLVRRPESRFSGEPELAFRSALLREAAYAMLTPADRELGHKLAGEWLEKHGEGDAMVLAHHFELGGDAPRAGVHLLRAAAQAMRGLDLDAAIVRAERALECDPSDEARLAAMDMLGEVHAWRFDWLTAMPYLEGVVRLAPRGSVPWIRATALKQSGAVVLGELGEMIEAMQALMSVEPAPDGASALVQALAFCAFMLCVSVQFGPARDVLARIDALAAPLAEADPVTRGFMHLGHVYVDFWADGDAWSALQRAEAAEQSFAEACDTRDASLARIFVGVAHVTLGAYEQAERDLAGLDDGEESMIAVLGEYTRMWALIERGAHGEARALIERQLQGGPDLRRMSDPTREPRLRWLLGEIARRTGDAEAAERIIVEAAEGLVFSPPERPLALSTLAAARLALGRGPEALAAAREAVEALNAHGGHAQRPGFVRLQFAEALYAAGDPAEARAALVDARDRMTALAAKIADPELRRSFLENLPEHARTTALAREKLGDG